MALMTGVSHHKSPFTSTCISYCSFTSAVYKLSLIHSPLYCLSVSILHDSSLINIFKLCLPYYNELLSSALFHAVIEKFLYACTRTSSTHHHKFKEESHKEHAKYLKLPWHHFSCHLTENQSPSS